MTMESTIMRGSDRYYPCKLCPNDHPSTTTILDVIGSKALMGWSAKMGTKKLLMYESHCVDIWEAIKKGGRQYVRDLLQEEWRKLGETSDFWKSGYESAKEAADHGTMAHAAFEMFLKGLPVDTRSLSEQARAAYQVFEKFAGSNEIKTIETEKTFYNCQIGYAGTADWLGTINGKLTLSDWKTSTGIFEKNIPQAWANAIADEMQNGNNLYQQILIGRFGKDGSTDILLAGRNGRLEMNGKVLQESGYFGSYEESRVLIKSCLDWFNYKNNWNKVFPYIKK